MMDPRPVTRDMLMGPIDICVDVESTSFHQARRLADEKAQEISPHTVLLAWFDRKAWRHSPAIC